MLCVVPCRPMSCVAWLAKLLPERALGGGLDGAGALRVGLDLRVDRELGRKVECHRRAAAQPGEVAGDVAGCGLRGELINGLLGAAGIGDDLRQGAEAGGGDGDAHGKNLKKESSFLKERSKELFRLVSWAAPQQTDKIF